MTDENQSENGEINEPEEVAAEDVVGGAEQPPAEQLEREQEIVEEPAPEPVAEAPAEEADETDEPAEQTPRVKPEIPGMDLEVDLAPASDRPTYSEEFDP